MIKEYDINALLIDYHEYVLVNEKFDKTNIYYKISIEYKSALKDIISKSIYEFVI